MGSCLSKCLVASTSKGKELMTNNNQALRQLQGSRGVRAKQKDKLKGKNRGKKRRTRHLSKKERAKLRKGKKPGKFYQQ